MSLDETTRPIAHDTALLPHRRGRPATPGSATAASLVLFIGAEFHPPAATCDLLARDGVRCLWLAGVEPALRAAGLAHFDAVVVDAGALGPRGAAVLGTLTAALRCPLIVVAQEADEIDEIVALEFGADAYLVEPLAPRRLRAHLAALMRLRPARASGPPTPPLPSAGAVRLAGWQLDRIGNRLWRADRLIVLTELQCALLQCLIEARGLIVARARLAASLPNRRNVGARSIDVYIHRLRQRLGDEGVAEFAIEAVRGRGYVLHVRN